jgi:hypothetical protein
MRFSEPFAATPTIVSRRTIMRPSDNFEERMIRALADPRSLPAHSILRSEECGEIDDVRERGWTLRLDCFDELQRFCPDCDEREFGQSAFAVTCCRRESER